jgi:hypothetical protein
MLRYILAFALMFGLSGLGSPLLAKTPDGETPATETGCAKLTGAAFGLCNAYCEAQDCDGQDPERASCDRLRANFERLTGATHFPCDRFCGDGAVDSDLGEECDPPGIECRSCDCQKCPPCEEADCDPCKPICECVIGTCADDCTCAPIVEECTCGAECVDANRRPGICRPTETRECTCVAN